MKDIHASRKMSVGERAGLFEHVLLHTPPCIYPFFIRFLFIYFVFTPFIYIIISDSNGTQEQKQSTASAGSLQPRRCHRCSSLRSYDGGEDEASTGGDDEREPVFVPEGRISSSYA